MSVLTHKTKVLIAKRLRTHTELISRKPIFETIGWETRKKQVAERVRKRIELAKLRAEQRKRLKDK